MPELDVTEEQLERIETVRRELEAAFLDGYGHMRRHDVVEYLLDTYTPPGSEGGGSEVPVRESSDEPVVADAGVEERVRKALDGEVRDEDGTIDYPALQSVARNTEGVKGSGTGAEEMYEAVLEAKVREIETGETDEVDVVGDAVDGAEADDGGDVVSGEGTDEGEASETDEGDSSETEASEGAPNGSATAASSGGGGSGGSQLQAMMNLLETHDGKWRKAASGDAPYEVDLPDGGTEAARTKDDVKRILFTNY